MIAVTRLPLMRRRLRRVERALGLDASDKEQDDSSSEAA